MSFMYFSNHPHFWVICHSPAKSPPHLQSDFYFKNSRVITCHCWLYDFDTSVPLRCPLTNPIPIIFFCHRDPACVSNVRGLKEMRVKRWIFMTICITWESEQRKRTIRNQEKARGKLSFYDAMKCPFDVLTEIVWNCLKSFLVVIVTTTHKVAIMPFGKFHLTTK